MRMKAISIMYHDVVQRSLADASGFPGADAALYKLEPEQFNEHLSAIAEAIKSAPASIFDILGGPGLETPFMLTFDDGGASAWTHIADALERHGWRGHFFITTGYIGTKSFMSREQILDLHNKGHIIGSHSATHPARLSHCSREEILREWQESVDALCDILGERVRVASVPGGFYSRGVAEAAALAGIEALFTSEPTIRCQRVGSCLVLGRYAIQNRMGANVAAALSTGRITPRLKQSLLWQAKKASKALGGESYLRIRKALLAKRTV